jgi:hypothetical protein
MGVEFLMQLRAKIIVVAFCLVVGTGAVEFPFGDASLLLAGNATGVATGKISTSLSNEIANAADDSPVRVIVRLKSDAEDMHSERGERRGAAFRRLREAARSRLNGSVEELQEKYGASSDGGVVARLLHPWRKRAVRQKARSFWVANCVALSVKPSELKGLAARSDVESVEPNALLSIPPVVAADDVSEETSDFWNLLMLGKDEAGALGMDGYGIRIGHLDTGLDITHPDLAGKVSAWGEFDAEGNGVVSEPHESHTPGHGTHTASILVGDLAGVAPCATLISALALPGGSGTVEQALSAMQWVLDPDDDPETDDGAQVVSMSWGVSETSVALREAVDNMLNAGVLPVAAIGNSGKGFTCSPGNAPGVVGVGAVDSDDVAPAYSGGGEVCWEDACVEKPDLTAPGSKVLGAKPGGGYQVMSGTSMAAPHVAGVAALLMQHAPGMGLAAIRGALYGGAVDLGSAGFDQRYGNGRIDALESADLLDQYAHRGGAVDLVLETTKKLWSMSMSIYSVFFADSQGDPLPGESMSIGATPHTNEYELKTLGVADVNGDGFSDLVTSQSRVVDSTTRSTEYEVYLSKDSSGFSSEAVSWGAFTSSLAVANSCLALTDVNGDRLADLVLCESKPLTYGRNLHLIVRLSTGKGFVASSIEFTYYQSVFVQAGISIGDVNGDRMADIVLTEGYSLSYECYPVYVSVTLSNGSGFAKQASWLTIYPANLPKLTQKYFNNQIVSDVNGDGYADLIICMQNYDGKRVYVYLSDGVSRFLSGSEWALFNAQGELSKVADLSGDGMGDLLISNLDADSDHLDLWVWKSNGAGHFLESAAPWLGPDGFSVSGKAAVVGLGDVGLGDWGGD